MRIVHVITRLIIGGAQENTLLTVEGLHHRYGDDVTLITGPAEGPEGDLFDRAERRGLKVEVMPELVRAIRPATDLRAYRQLRAAIRRLQARGRPHAQLEGGDPRPGGGLARAGAGRRAHDPRPAVRAVRDRRCRNRLYIALERWAARRCHAIVSVCDAMTEQALAAGVGRPEQYSTVYSGMDVDAFLNPPRPRDEVRRELGLADDEVAFGTVARLFERKGHDDILAVAPAVLAANPEVRFVFIGDGILRDRLIADAERLGVRHAFHLHGPGAARTASPSCSAAVDAVVHPSLREGLARVLPQALLVGRPVISYDVDGAREVVLPETGILLEPRDLDGPRRRDPPAGGRPGAPRRRWAQEGRRRFADQFRHETMTRPAPLTLRSVARRPVRPAPSLDTDRLREELNSGRLPHARLH